MPAGPADFRKVLPQLSVFLLLLGLAFTLVNPVRPLADPGAGWQLKTGQWLLQNKSLPTHDPFSYTVPGQPWILYQWLFQTGAGFLQQLGGISLVMMVCTFIYALCPVILVQRMLEQRANLLVAMLAAFVVWMVMTMHDQTRPHVFTYLFFSLYLWILERVYRSSESGPGLIKVLVPLPLIMVLWCNIHGGFITGLVLCGIFSVAALLDFAGGRKPEHLEKAKVFSGCLLLCAVASLINPYGYGLHQAIAGYLKLESLRFWMEFASPFAISSLNVHLFEGTVLALLVLLALGRSRLNWAELGCLLFFLHHAFLSVRHVNLFMIVAGPVVARLLTETLAVYLPGWTERMVGIGREQLACRTHRFYLPLIGAAWISLVWLAPSLLPRGLPDLRLGKGAVAYIDGHREQFAGMFNTDDLGGALIYRFGPEIKVFMDDRTDLYRDDFILKTYLPIIQLQPGWKEKLEAHAVTSAVLPAGTALGAALKEAGWENVFSDDKNEIFLKNGQSIKIP